MNAFETWWYNEGSAAPIPGEDSEEHCKRMCQIAWENGAFCAEQQEPVAFYIYKPTLPHGNLGTVADGDLPWVYDQDPSSGFSARMLVTPYTSRTQPT